MTATTRGSTEYRYPHFKRQVMFADLAFAGGPVPGQPMPDFDLPSTDGGRVRRRDFAGEQPLLLTFGSVT